ncbi:nitroreductase family deazaflavin-dependent oxidoreductase [Pseudonocardiaceae bacterium YIM PH 21723]|nr:nitroreductase family deazaflavin-dependent oxidoreductase [Pseudonocardiaceae bacterium YIM PH 21723]
MSFIVQQLGKTAWFVVLLRLLARCDRAFLQWTKGRVSIGAAGGAQELLLTVPGRRTGIPRTVAMLYFPYHASWAVIDTNWGRPRRPDWSANLVACPDAEITLNGHRIPVRPRLLSGAERADVWREALATWPAISRYDRRSGDRELRVFLLQPWWLEQRASDEDDRRHGGDGQDGALDLAGVQIPAQGIGQQPTCCQEGQELGRLDPVVGVHLSGQRQ